MNRVTTMAPRFKPKTILEKGLEQHLIEQGINFALFKLLSKAQLSDTAIAEALSEEYRERVGIEHKFDRRTIKKYRELL